MHFRSNVNAAKPLPKAVLGLLWFMMAISSFVMIEPAPVDLLAVLLFVVAFLAGLRAPTGIGMPALLAGIYIVSNFVSIMFAEPNVKQPFGYIVFYAALTVYMFVLWFLFAALVAAETERVMRVVWSGWGLAATVAVFLGVAGYFRAIPFADLFIDVGRAKGPFKDPNVFGPFLIPIALWVLVSMQGRTFAGIAWRFGLFLFFCLGLLLAFSRGAWGHFILSVFVLIVLQFLSAKSLRDYFRLFGATAAGLAFLIVAGSIAISIPEIRSMVEIRASFVQKYDVEEGGRFSTQSAAIAHIATDPIGLGPNRTHTALGRVPHNVYLKVFAENGWIGGLSFLIFVISSLWRGFWGAIKPGPYQTQLMVIYATLSGTAIESLVIDSLHWRHYFVLHGILWGLLIASDHATKKAGRLPEPRYAVT